MLRFCSKIQGLLCSGITVLWRCHIALALVDYDLSRAFSHLDDFGLSMFLLQ